MRAADFERDAASGLLLPRGAGRDADRGLRRLQRPRFMTTGPAFFGGGGGATDPYFSNVVLLLHMDGANGGTSFPDSSASAKTVSSRSVVTTSTAQAKFGTASADFTSAGWMQHAASADFQFQSGEFTVEAWVYPTSWSSSDFNAISGTYAGSPGGWLFGFFSSGTQIHIRNGDSTSILQNITGGAPALNTWHHAAVSRVGTTAYFFVDGVMQGAGSSFGVSVNYSRFLETGGYYAGVQGGAFAGYIDELRITKGVGRYTANFTPPTAAFPNS